MSFLSRGKSSSDAMQEQGPSSLLGLDRYTAMSPVAGAPKGLDSEVRLDPSWVSNESARGTCGNAECVSSWTMPWRNRRRPLFEGEWGCSGRCILAMVRAAIRRERGERSLSPVNTVHRHRVPLGLVMLAQGWITHPQLQMALEAQRSSGSGRIGDWLVSECGLESEQVTRGLSVQWSCPVLSLDGFTPERMALVAPRLFLEEFGIVPLRIAGSRLIYLAFESRLDASAALAVEQMTGLKVQSGLLEASQLQIARARLLECDAVPARLEKSGDEDSLAARITAVLEQRQPIGSRLVRLHGYYWLRIWLESGTKGMAGTMPRSAEDMEDYLYPIQGRA